MTAKIPEADLQKALSALQDLAKSKGETISTEDAGMVGVSGATQVFHTPSNSDPGGWAGSSWRGEGWEDHISENGTDVEVRKLGKSIAKAVASKLTKGEALSPREANFVVKGGMNFKDMKDEDKAEKAFPPKDKDKDEVEKAHADAAEDKKQIKDMVKPNAMKVEKSLLDFAGESEEISKGFEMSSFLADFAGAVAKSQGALEARLGDRVLTAIAKSQVEAEKTQASLAKALASLGEVLSLHSQRIDQVEAGPARGPKSQTAQIVKSQYEGEPAGESLNKSQVESRLLELMEKSECSANDVIRFNSTGNITPELMRKVKAR
jgi:hypothetical protein